MKFEKIYSETNENVRLALTSLWAPGHHPMRSVVENVLDKESLFAEPAFQSMFGWTTVDNDSWRQSLNNHVITALHIDEKTPYAHQAESWNILSNPGDNGKALVVTSGTGSGKTECFMYPVLNDIYVQETAERSNAIRAVFLYPLNALMEDQKNRLSNHCSRLGLRFGVYNSSTPHLVSQIPQAYPPMPGEVGSREEIIDANNAGTRPQILLTNPSMLEYILVRREDCPMLEQSAGKLRWIVIDESHTYSGSAAVELRYQIKRILDAFQTDLKDVRFACTSATIGGADGGVTLKKFISSITGLSEDSIYIVGGQRNIPSLDYNSLSRELQARNLPAADRVLALRNEINNHEMFASQMWQTLMPNAPYNVVSALKMLDELCELNVDNKPVLSIRAHFFMRTVDGMFACGSDSCANRFGNPYGYLTTERTSICPHCGSAMVEVIQCKQCASFMLMGESQSQGDHAISACEEKIFHQDEGLFDMLDDDEDDEDVVENAGGNDQTFIILPYDVNHHFKQMSSGHEELLDISWNGNHSCLVNGNRWVSLHNVANGLDHLHCPECGKLAKSRKLKAKHFRIPVSFINQAVSPVLLKESARENSAWGKYIAFTDSRQGTAISAKTFNIDVEKMQVRKHVVARLAQQPQAPAMPNAAIIAQNNPALAHLDPAIIAQVLAAAQQENAPNVGISLREFADCAFESVLLNHYSDNPNAEVDYKKALVRNTLGRRPLFESNIETMGFVSLVYPSLSRETAPNCLHELALNEGISDIDDNEWRNFLKICIDFHLRLRNHVHCIEHGEESFVRDSNRSKPIAGPFSPNLYADRWPSVRVNADNRVSSKQPRLVMLLCAGLGIDSLGKLERYVGPVNQILASAWDALVRQGILVPVVHGTGYGESARNNSGYYLDCHYLDLSLNSSVCRVVRPEDLWICPVTNKLLDVRFCGYSPLLIGELSQRLFNRFVCATSVRMPVAPLPTDDYDAWLQGNQDVQSLKQNGLWTDRHKYVYKETPAYLAAEHSAQQERDVLAKYTQMFKADIPELNVLHCSTTMEMGVNIGDIDMVLLDTIPPTSANYLQRIGRAGRSGQCKAVAFSLCNNTAVGKSAFSNPMWALNASNERGRVAPSRYVIQRHVNSYFFRKFVWVNGNGISASITFDEYVRDLHSGFVNMLNSISTDPIAQARFEEVFGADLTGAQISFAMINTTKDQIEAIVAEYEEETHNLSVALQEANDAQQPRRASAIERQLDKIRNEKMLPYLSVKQFIPNANMPTDSVEFEFIDQQMAYEIDQLRGQISRLERGIAATDDIGRQETLRRQIKEIRYKLNKKYASRKTARDIRTALNEYAPGQTIVVDEKNYISAGVKIYGAHNAQMRSRWIRHCRNCGMVKYTSQMPDAATRCECGRPFYGVLNNDGRTRAFEPIGFTTDQCKSATGCEKTNKVYYDIRPELLNTEWGDSHTHPHMYQVSMGTDLSEILFYNAGEGNGFAICMLCGRTAVENGRFSRNNLPFELQAHKALYGNETCPVAETDIARNVVLTGRNQTSFTAFRFNETVNDSQTFSKDKELVLSLGVVLKKALVRYLGIDEGEIDFGTKVERDALVLFIYDTAKGGCGYSLKFRDERECAEIFRIAFDIVNEFTCTCKTDGGCCTACLVDRTTQRIASRLSTKAAYDWLALQRLALTSIPQHITAYSANASIFSHALKDVVRRSIESTDVVGLTFVVSDEPGNTIVSQWKSYHSEMGRLIHRAIECGKNVSIKVEYHPEYHQNMADKLPYLNLADIFTDCDVQFVQSMGQIKTALIVETQARKKHFFTDNAGVLSFSNEWGDFDPNVFEDNQDAVFVPMNPPIVTVEPNKIVRDGIITVESTRIDRSFANAIAPAVGLTAEDEEIIRSILSGKHVNVYFSDMFVNSALAGLMLTYLIKELRERYNFVIDSVTLALDSPRRKCENDHWNLYRRISRNFPSAREADDYVDRLFDEIFGIDAEHSLEDAVHYRWLRIENLEGDVLEIRPDHSISGGWECRDTYSRAGYLDGSTIAEKDSDDILYYVIIRRHQ